MQEQTSRYVADIEVPEGIVSIDCEVRNGDKPEVLFILNSSTCEGTENPPVGISGALLRAAEKFSWKPKRAIPKPL